MMTQEYIELDSCPVEFDGCQVGESSNKEMMLEAKRMIELLEKKFPNAPGWFKPVSNQHDFGTYITVRYTFDDDDNGWLWANHIENNFPLTWEDDTVIEDPAES